AYPSVTTVTVLEIFMRRAPRSASSRSWPTARVRCCAARSKSAITACRSADRRWRAGPDIPRGQKVLQLLKPSRHAVVGRQGNLPVVIADRDPADFVAIRFLAEPNDGRGVDKASSCGAQEKHLSASILGGG